MFGAGEDVNTGATTPSATSTENVASTGTEVKAADTSAETLKTEVEQHETHVPYDRFKEVNERAKKAEDSLKIYEEKKALIEASEQLNQMISANPALYAEIENALKKYGSPQSHQIQQQIQSGDPLAQQVALNMYVGEFNRMSAEDKVPEGLKPYYFEFAKNELMKINPQPLANFNLGLVGQAYSAAKKHIDSIRQAELASYVTEKKADASIPASGSSTGAPPVHKVELKNQNSRSEYMANALKASTM